MFFADKDLFLKLGFSVMDFEMMTWLTSWAVNQSGEHGHTEFNLTTDQKEEIRYLQAFSSMEVAYSICKTLPCVF